VISNQLGSLKAPFTQSRLFWIERNHVQGQNARYDGLSVGVGDLERDARRRILGKVPIQTS
jgi:hypothetical protein